MRVGGASRVVEVVKGVEEPTSKWEEDEVEAVGGVGGVVEEEGGAGG